jgi:hypothetical protein
MRDELLTGRAALAARRSALNPRVKRGCPLSDLEFYPFSSIQWAPIIIRYLRFFSSFNFCRALQSSGVPKNAAIKMTMYQIDLRC